MSPHNNTPRPQKSENLPEHLQGEPNSPRVSAPKRPRLSPWTSGEIEQPLKISTTPGEIGSETKFSPGHAPGYLQWKRAPAADLANETEVEKKSRVSSYSPLLFPYHPLRNISWTKDTPQSVKEALSVSMTEPLTEALRFLASQIPQNLYLGSRPKKLTNIPINQFKAMSNFDTGRVQKVFQWIGRIPNLWMHLTIGAIKLFDEALAKHMIIRNFGLYKNKRLSPN